MRIPSTAPTVGMAPQCLLTFCLPRGFVGASLIFVSSQISSASCLSPVFLSCVRFPQQTESQSCVTAVLSWIKREEEPHCPEQQGSEKEEIPAEPSAGRS